MDHHQDDQERLQVSVVIPCLNEKDTIASVVKIAVRTLSQSGIPGEVIVADNGSTDGSIELALNSGARVVPVPKKGYGNALMGGIEASHGQYIIMGDADGSYDFAEIPQFVDRLNAGFELVQGCRLPAGGGTVMPGAMPFLHRWLGNPGFTWLVRRMFKAPVNDVYCGLRGFTRSLYDSLMLNSPGMEFATEMIIKASLSGARISEIPITLSPDGRKTTHRHLRTFRDGWRTLRFFMMHSPRWLFLYPGIAFVLLGILGYVLTLSNVSIGPAKLGPHTLLVSSMCMVVGLESMIFSVVATTYGVVTGWKKTTRNIEGFYQFMPLERALTVAMLLVVFGIAVLGIAFTRWYSVGFGNLEYSSTMKLVIPAVTSITSGIQIGLGSFLCSIIAMHRFQRS